MNRYRKALLVQILYKFLNDEGHSNEWIIKNFIAPKLMISRSTFYEYLELPAKKWLKNQIGGETHIRDIEQLSEVYKFIYQQMENKKRIR
jgi:hypothetical protein